MLSVSSNRCCATDPTVKEELEETLQNLKVQLPKDTELENSSKIFAGLSHPLRQDGITAFNQRSVRLRIGATHRD